MYVSLRRTARCAWLCLIRRGASSAEAKRSPASSMRAQLLGRVDERGKRKVERRPLEERAQAVVVGERPPCRRSSRQGDVGERDALSPRGPRGEPPVGGGLRHEHVRLGSAGHLVAHEHALARAVADVGDSQAHDRPAIGEHRRDRPVDRVTSSSRASWGSESSAGILIAVASLMTCNRTRPFSLAICLSDTCARGCEKIGPRIRRTD